MNKEQIIAEIVNLTAAYPHRDNVSWKKPLVAFARADDSLFKSLKEIISPAHALPVDLLPEAVTVITYFLAFTENIVQSNIKGRYCSQLWAQAYMETNKLIKEINRNLQEKLKSAGYKTAYAPATHNFDQENLRSDWSHRSAAYIAGLGTFGLNRMLITEHGCCGRIGSLVTDLDLPATSRPAQEFCLYKQDQSCGRCTIKCVNSSLKIEFYDRHRCYEMLLLNAKRQANLESIADVCGKCLVGVPCSTSIPI